jgi:hypothetical protein
VPYYDDADAFMLHFVEYSSNVCRDIETPSASETSPTLDIRLTCENGPSNCLIGGVS